MSLFRSGKCRAKNPSACSDPRCPEKRSGGHLLAQAIKRGDLDAYIKERDQQEKRLKVERLEKSSMPSDWDRLWLKDEATNEIYRVPVEPELKSGSPKDTSVIKRYASWEDMGDDLRAPNITVRLINNTGPYHETSLPGFTLADMYVSPALRGKGIGSHIMKTLTTHADEKGLAIELIPTEAGDGRLEEGQPGWREAAIAHQERLIAFYESHGFERNPFYHYMGQRDPETGHTLDYLTGKPHIPNPILQAKFTAKAERILRDHSMYIRFPNGKYPKGWLRGPAKRR